MALAAMAPEPAESEKARRRGAENTEGLGEELGLGLRGFGEDHLNR